MLKRMSQSFLNVPQEQQVLQRSDYPACGFLRIVGKVVCGIFRTGTKLDSSSLKKKDNFFKKCVSAGGRHNKVVHRRHERSGGEDGRLDRCLSVCSFPD